MAFQIKITLCRKPNIWRLVLVPHDYTLSDLHIIFQSSMGWNNEHLYEFRIFEIENDVTIIYMPDNYHSFDNNFVDSRYAKIADLFPSDVIARYIYDFGDSWEHLLEIEEFSQKTGFVLPQCIDGEGACPDEDSGGIDEYLHQLKLNKKPLSKSDPKSVADNIERRSFHDYFSIDEVSFWKAPPTRTKLTPSECEMWLRKLLHGKVTENEIVNEFCSLIPVQDIIDLRQIVLNKPLRNRNRAMVLLGYLKGIDRPMLSNYLLMAETTVGDLLKRYLKYGIEQSIYVKKKGFKHEKQEYLDKVFEILHSPPSSYGFNRTSWRQDDIIKVMSDENIGISKNGLREIFKSSGYKYKKARTVLTSNDPQYREKLDNIKNILSNLKCNEKFFSIDEYGPCAIKLKGGKSLVPKETYKSVPQWQTSKGSLILTAALELSTNQVSHFYSDKKNTDEMIKLLNLLVAEYSYEKTIYFSWDAASWHASKELYKSVDKINSAEYKKKHKCPEVKLAPLPKSAQFLNVIESVFSGMSRAIIPLLSE